MQLILDHHYDSLYMATVTNTVDLSDELDFLVEQISIDESPLSMLLSSQILHKPFSSLYQRSQEIGWKTLFMEERNRLRLDDRSKQKRFLLNRLIHECSTNADGFEQQAQAMIKEIKKLMSSKITLSQEYGLDFPIVDFVFAEVEIWRQLLRDRRLFDDKGNNCCGLLALQRVLTDHFMYLANALDRDAAVVLPHARQAFSDLFHYSMIIVAQPSGTDCLTATKYEKVGRDYLAKLKTKVICLLDFSKIGEFLQCSNVDITLRLKEQHVDPIGDTQTSLVWKSRKVYSSEKEVHTLFYVELTEADSIKLARMNSRNKPLYNSQLCYLEFQVKLKIDRYGLEYPVRWNSELFGVCSHAKYYPKYLAQVFLNEIERRHHDIALEVHINTLAEYVFQFHKRLSGATAKQHTRHFIQQQLHEVFKKFQESARLINTPVPIFSFSIYQNTLDKLFNQIKFLGDHPFLAMMYSDSLFHGICSDSADNEIQNSAWRKPKMIMRFESFQQQHAIGYPNIIFAFHNNSSLRRSLSTHEHFIDDICKCFSEAEKAESSELVIHNDHELVPFRNFSWYYDNGLNRENVILKEDRVVYYPLQTLLYESL